MNAEHTHTVLVVSREVRRVSLKKGKVDIIPLSCTELEVTRQLPEDLRSGFCCQTFLFFRIVTLQKTDLTPHLRQLCP